MMNTLHRSSRLPSLALGLIAMGICAPLVANDPEPPRLKVNEVELYDDDGARELMFRVAAPERGAPYPLVVFSHGALCGPDTYARITDYWAAAGYVVVAPRHVDATTDRETIGAMNPATLLDSRLADIAFVMDNLDDVEQAAGIPGLIDRDRAAIAGHSFGGMIAQIISGLRLKDPATGAALDKSDERFKAAVVLSGVGPMPQMADDAFAYLRGPLIATGGTEDVGNVGSGPIHPWEWRLSPYALAPAGDKYALVMNDGGHFLGGLICKAQPDARPDPVALQAIQEATTLFLEAYIAGKPKARATLRQSVGASGRREFALK
jgi:dienelactone hydrolase